MGSVGGGPGAAPAVAEGPRRGVPVCTWSRSGEAGGPAGPPCGVPPPPSKLGPRTSRPLGKGLGRAGGGPCSPHQSTERKCLLPVPNPPALPARGPVPEPSAVPAGSGGRPVGAAPGGASHPGLTRLGPPSLPDEEGQACGEARATRGETEPTGVTGLSLARSPSWTPERPGTMDLTPTAWQQRASRGSGARGPGAGLVGTTGPRGARRPPAQPGEDLPGSWSLWHQRAPGTVLGLRACAPQVSRPGPLNPH